MAIKHWAALGLFAALVCVFWAARTSGAPSPAFLDASAESPASPVEGAQPYGPQDVELPAAALNRAEATGQSVPAIAEPKAQPRATTGSDPVGRIVGYVSDAKGEPVKRELRFQRLTPVPSMRVTKTDSAGFYSMPLEPGAYRVFVDWRRDPGVALGDPSFAAAGDVHVFEGRDTLLDITAVGTRTLRGGFASEEHDEMLLEVELVLAEDPTLVVAKALAIRDDAKRLRFEEAEAVRAQETPRRPNTRRYPPGMGYFEIEGVPAELYEARVYLDVKKTLFVKAIVDLRQGDFDFVPESIATESFFERETIVLTADSK